MKKIIYSVLFLMIIGAVSGLSLSFVNEITAPIIEKNSAGKEQELLNLIFDVDSFTTKVEDGEYVKKSYTCDLGIIYYIESKGYGDTKISYLIGIDNKGSYSGYEIVDMSQETVGIGTKIADKDFVEMITSAKVKDSLDTISGATISSSAVIKGIEEAAKLYESR